MNKYFALACLMTVVLLSAPTVYAEDSHEDTDRFDGSEYAGETFTDTEFKKPDYKELKSMNAAAKDLARDDKGVKEGVGLLHKRADKGVSVAAEGGGNPIDEAREHVIGKKEREPIYDLPGDWAPNVIVLTANGAFGVIPDTGSVVPYRLNGHVDIERGRP